MAPIISSLSGLYQSLLYSKKNNELPVIATGGAITEYVDGGQVYRLHTFTTNENFVYTSGPGIVDVLVLGGGGAGGRTGGDQDTGKGGGGSGGLAFALSIPIAEGATCPVVVGTGGNGNYLGSGYSGRSVADVRIPGNNSTFTIPSGPYTITGAGGGAGGIGDTGNYPVSGDSIGNRGVPGGCGGGAACRSSSTDYSGGSTTQPGFNPGLPWVTNYGNPGGSSSPTNNSGGGGGGGTAPGSAGVGGNHSGGQGGTGADGTTSLGSLPAASTTLLYSNAFIGTIGVLSDNESINTSPTGTRARSGNTTTTYLGGGGSGGSAPGSPARGGRGGGGRGTSGLNFGQSVPAGTLMPLGNHPQVHGLDFSGGGGGGSADDPYSGGSGPGVGLPSGYNGHGGKGVVVIRYALGSQSILTTDPNSQLKAGEYIQATGGTVTTDGDYKIHTFTHPNPTATSPHPDTFTVTQVSSDDLLNTVRVLVIGGGASGGVWYGGGGGAGGVAETYQYPIPGAGGAVSIPVQVGHGGAARPAGAPGNGINGGDSHFGPASLRMFAYGGGAGASGGSTGTQAGDGGAGGGGGQSAVNINRPGRGLQQRVDTTVNAVINCFNYGFPGGYANSSSDSDAGGGGGAGGSGGNAGGPGGTGMSSDITGTSVAYAGGGGAANPSNSSLGGSGGGGNGGGPAPAGAGTDGKGGGGGGIYAGSTGPSGKGGTGVVIVRYKYQ